MYEKPLFKKDDVILWTRNSHMPENHSQVTVVTTPLRRLERYERNEWSLPLRPPYSDTDKDNERADTPAYVCRVMEGIDKGETLLLWENVLRPLPVWEPCPGRHKRVVPEIVGARGTESCLWLREVE